LFFARRAMGCDEFVVTAISPTWPKVNSEPLGSLRVNVAYLEYADSVSALAVRRSWGEMVFRLRRRS
jgi:hypothetical protein